MKKISILFIALGLAACGDEAGTVTLEGLLQAVQQGFLVPVDPAPTVAVVGRNADEFTTIVSSTVAGDQVSFRIKNLPKAQDLVFRTSGSGLETVISFPVSTSSETVQSLPILIAGSIGAFIALAEDDAGINIDVDTSLGIVAGVVAPTFGNGVVSTGGPVVSVRMVQKNEDIEISYMGPYYFDSGGNLVDSGSCPDTECNYIFFDVPEGAYRFQQLGTGEQVLDEKDVVVLASQMTFGME
ncbi:MAG: hypothetical protein R3A45_13005 [Bdellovibrionota bacterium]|nr:hypothetical protein [Deltaproteobacteria bacterium]